MLLNEIPFQDVIPIQGYGQNNFRINNKYYEGGIFIFTNIIIKWSGFNDFSFSKFDISDLDIMFIGMGVRNKKPINIFKDFFIKKNIILECFSTPTACRAYNVTISSHRKAGALLMPIKNLNS